MYREMDLRSAPKRKKLTAKSLIPFLKLSNYSPTKVTLAKLSDVEASKCLTYLSRCKTVQELYLYYSADAQCDKLDVTGFSSLRILKTSRDFAMSAGDMRNVCGNLPQLEHLEIWLKAHPSDTTLLDFPTPMKNLRSLTIGALNWIKFTIPEDSPEQNMGDRFPQLEQINFIEMTLVDFPDLSKCTTLRRVGFLACSATNLPRLLLPNGVEHLSLSRTCGHIQHIDWQPQCLRSIVWNDAQRPGEDALTCLLMDHSENLVYLDLENCRDAALPIILHESIENGHLRSVTDLNVARVPLINRETIDLIIKHMPALKRLNISATQTDASSIRKLVNAKDMKLERLVCHALLTERSYQDAVTLARDHGIEIPVVKTTVPPSESLRQCAF